MGAVPGNDPVKEGGGYNEANEKPGEVDMDFLKKQKSPSPIRSILQFIHRAKFKG